MAHIGKQVRHALHSCRSVAFSKTHKKKQSDAFAPHETPTLPHQLLSAMHTMWHRPAAWLALYFAANLGLTLFNKRLLLSFPFPWGLTAVHALCGWLGAQIVLEEGWFAQTKLGRREYLILLAFSVLYTVNIAISNVSLQLVSVPFHQVVRSTTPLFTIVLSLLFLRRHHSRRVCLSLIPVVVGVMFATWGEHQATRWGFFLTLSGTVLAAMKGLATNVIQVGRMRLHPLDLLLRMSPLAFVQSLALCCVTGEAARIYDYALTSMTRSDLFALALNGALAFSLNIVSFTANKKTSALTMTVAANVKQVLTILLAVYVFQIQVTGLALVGITLTLLGGVAYAVAELEQKRAAKQAMSPLSTVAVQTHGPIPWKA